MVEQQPIAEKDVTDDLAERLYEWSGGIFWRGETTWQDRHLDEARQWFAYAELLTRVLPPGSGRTDA